jgi:hypothetical protein
MTELVEIVLGRRGARPQPKNGWGGVAAAGCTASPVERCVVGRRKNGAPVFVLLAGNCAGDRHGGTARLGGSSRVIEGIQVRTKAGPVRAVGSEASLGRMTGDRAPFQGAVITSGDDRMSRWPPSRPLRRSAQAESEVIGRCGRRIFGCATLCCRGRGPCRSRSAHCVGKRYGVKSFRCVRGDGVRGVPVLRDGCRNR